MSQQFWSGDGGDAYVTRIKGFVNTKYQDGSRLDIIKEVLWDVPRDSSVLEIGCSKGNFIGVLKDLGFYNITGLDVNESALEKATKRFPELLFFNCSIEELDTDLKYDFVVTCDVLIHIDRKSLPDVIDKIKQLSRHHIYGEEYFSEEEKQIDYFSYCASDDYPSMFEIKPYEVQIHTMIKKARAPTHAFYLLEK